jgi:tetratricopeptide (TPR) repeat protein
MNTANDLIDAAFERHQAGDLDKAEALYLEALSVEPDSLNGLQLLGLLTHQRGRTVEAITLLNQAIAVLEGRAEAPAVRHAALYNNMGNVLWASGRAAEAVANYRRGIALDPNLAELHANLGNVLLAQGDSASAIASYEVALNLGPLSTQCRSHLADAYTAAGRLADAQRVHLDTPATLAQLANSAT